MNIRRVERKLSDFINSEYHRYNTDYVSAAPLRARMKYIGQYRNLQSTVGETLYVAFSGRGELIRFAQDTVYDLYSLSEDECLCLSFEDFSVYFITVLHTKSDGKESLMRVPLLDKKTVWYPRRCPCKLDPAPTSMAIEDRSCNSMYILPELNYPINKADKLNFIRWLRVNKQLLYIKYACDDYNVGRQNYFPRFRDRWFGWYKRVKIYLGDDIKEVYDKNPYRVDYIKQETIISDAMGSVLNNLKIKPCGTITQDVVDEFVDWQNNRYRILE